MAFSDAYQVLIHQTFGAGVFLNTFCVERLDPGFTSEDIREAFIDTILEPWKDCVLDDVSFDTIDVLSLSDPEDFEVGFAIGQTGNGSGLVGPGLVAASVRFNRTRRDVRHGYSRISGIAEESYTGNQWIAGFVDDLEAYGNALVGLWTKQTPEAEVAVLHVVKRVLVPATQDHRAYYRLPEVAGEYVSYHPESIFVSPYVTSQVSRKIRA